MQAHQVKREIEPTMQTFEYEYEVDNSDSANIMIDSNGDISDIHAWGTIFLIKLYLLGVNSLLHMTVYDKHVQILSLLSNYNTRPKLFSLL